MLLISMKFLPFLASVNVIINYENSNSSIFSVTLTTGQENERAMVVRMIGLSLCHFCFYMISIFTVRTILPNSMQLISLYKGFLSAQYEVFHCYPFFCTVSPVLKMSEIYVSQQLT